MRRSTNQERKRMSKEFSIIFIGSIIAIALSIIVEAKQTPLVCQDETTVAEILSLHYRSATIKLADDTTVDVDQATLKPGDKFCKRYNR